MGRCQCTHAFRLTIHGSRSPSCLTIVIPTFVDIYLATFSHSRVFDRTVLVLADASISISGKGFAIS